MRVTDILYDEWQIGGVLEELIMSKPVQRLKGIHQGGASYLINEKWNVTRYEHSVGVMLLIRKLGGSLEEQIAGLLHDISHTAFSHVIDFVFENKAEDFHEKIYHRVVGDSEIPGILEKYGYHYEEILSDLSKWTLLDQPAPELCADRVDYTLRDMVQYGWISLEEAKCFLEHLTVMNGRMYPKDVEAAEWFVKTYYKEVIDFFMNPLNVYGYHALAKTLKTALAKNVIDFNDLLGTDESVMNILDSSEDDEIRSLLRQIRRNARVKEDQSNFDFHFKNKVRLIDPSVPFENRWVRASALSEDIKRMGEQAYNKMVNGIYVKILSNE
ncbi:HD domain-containing protein [Caenibacillus caldisaponilyticus]|uniref:HD domain-containing protein n=1 Tax=Caenibacillus caldisaponilyticus TaxID=1674942 RepID=UPI0009885025|nr:HD domain-containing protein [Caenibacillus caldisaponilyticus]